MSDTTEILVLEDDRSFATALTDYLSGQNGWSVTVTSSVPQGFRQLESGNYNVVVLDWYLGTDGSVLNGDEFLKRKKEGFRDTWVIVYSGGGDSVKAKALAQGADAFVDKGIDSIPRLIGAIESGLQAQPVKSGQVLAERLTSSAMDQILGTSPGIGRVRDFIEKVAASDIPVMIRGESGVGKGLVARAIHELSPRHNAPFVPVPCPSISATLLESELFGHTKGAFTGAGNAKKGLVEFAHKGTLFLDEIGDLPLDLQPKLLHVLENGEIRRVGSLKSIQLDVRFVSATNRALESMIGENTFRRDLFTRLEGIVCTIPPLRERREDIPVLLNSFLGAAARKQGSPLPQVADSAMNALMAYSFPGNIRELQSMSERSVILNPTGPLQAADFSLAAAETGDVSLGALNSLQWKEARAAFEKQYLEEWMNRCDGSIIQVVKQIDISRNQLHRLLKTYQLKGARARKDISE